MKNFIFILFCLYPSFIFSSVNIISYGVDGSSTNPEVVISNRNPLFHWEFEGDVSSFTIIVSTDPIYTKSNEEMWYYSASTSSLNTINRITRIEYNGKQLSPNTTYYWKVTVYDKFLSSSSVQDYFYTVISVLPLPSEKVFLEIDYNNPFSPANGEKTKIRYCVKDRDRYVYLRIFTVSGKLIKILSQHTAIKDAYYTVEWDGKSENGEILPRGVYFVNLECGGNIYKTKIVVIK